MRQQFALVFLAVLGVPALAGEAPAPIRALDYFVGGWTCQGVFPASGRTIASRMRYDSDLQGRAVLKHHEDTSPPANYRAVEAWGYDAGAKRYNATILDSSGSARRFTSDGWQHDVLAWTASADLQPPQRFVYRRMDARHYRVDWEIARDGSHYTVGDTLTCTRD